MRRLVRYLRPYRGAVVVSLAFLAFQSVTQVAGPLLTKLAIDRYLVKAEHPSHTFLDPWLPSGAVQGLIFISTLYLAAVLIGLICDFAQTYLMSRTGQLAMFDLRRELMDHMQRLDVGSLRSQSGGPLDHASDHGRRRAERTVGLRTRDDPGRCTGAGFIRDHSDARAKPGHDWCAARHDAVREGHLALPPERSVGLTGKFAWSSHASTRIPGAHRGNLRGPALQSRTTVATNSLKINRVYIDG